MRISKLAIAALALLAGTTLASAATKDDAVAMVKKALAAIKADGAEKTIAAINQPHGPYQNGEIYVVISDYAGVTVAHATNSKLIGKNMMEAQDVDGKFFSRDMTQLAQKQPSFWYDYKFVNPVTKKIQVKDNYCESLPKMRVCAGVYRP